MIVPYDVTIHGIDFVFYDQEESITVDIVLREVGIGDYYVDGLNFRDGDVLIDIGAHVGIVSIYWAKINPNVKIYAFEPNNKNYECLIKNIEINHVDNVFPFNVAISSDRRKINGIVQKCNSGHSVSVYDKEEYDKNTFDKWQIHSVTLNDIFMLLKIEKCKILKIDCEGVEYEILYNTNIEFIKSIEYIFGEFHMTNYLRGLNYYLFELVSYCNQYVNNMKVVLYENYDGLESAYRCTLVGHGHK